MSKKIDTSGLQGDEILGIVRSREGRGVVVPDRIRHLVEGCRVVCVSARHQYAARLVDAGLAGTAANSEDLRDTTFYVKLTPKALEHPAIVQQIALLPRENA